MKALTKEEALELAKNRTFPDFVIAAFNELITRMVLCGDSRIMQDEAVDCIIKHEPSVTRQDIFLNHWLDVEDFYRQAGWTVTFYKPAYSQVDKAYYTFK